jgi:hypothetical protein
MAKTGQERPAKAAEKRIEYDERELQPRLRLGARQKLEKLMAWSDIEKISEAVQNLILNVHGTTLPYQAIQSPHHKVQISENMARIFQDPSLAELKLHTGEEIIAPLENL